MGRKRRKRNERPVSGPDLRDSFAVSFSKSEVAVVSGLCLLALTVPLAISFLTIEAGYVKQVAYQLAVPTLSCVGLYATLAKRHSPIRLTLLWVALVGYWATHFASLAVSQFPLTGWFEVWRVSVLLLLFLLVMQFVNSPNRRRALLWSFAIGAILVSLYGFAQKMGWDPITWSQTAQTRVFASIGNPNMLAGYCVALAPPLIGLGCIEKRKWAKAAAFVSGGLLIAVLFLTLSRGGIFGFVMQLLILGIYWGIQWRKGSNRRLSAVIGGGLLAVVLFLVIPNPVSNRFRELSRLNTTEHGSQNVRLVIWQGALKIATDHPVVGCGPGAFAAYYPQYRATNYQDVGLTHNTLHAHSEFVEILSELGVVGLTLFLLIVVALMKIALRSIATKEEPDWPILAGALLGIIGLLAHNIVTVNMRWPMCAFMFWVFAGMVASFDRPREKELPSYLATRWFRGVATAVALISAAVLCYYAVWMPFQSEICYHKAKRLNRRGKYTQAAELLDLSVGYRADNVRALYLLAHSHFESGKLKKAIEAYRRLQRHSPDYAQIHHNLAACYLRLGEWENAAEEFGLQQKIGGLPDGLHFRALIATLTQKENKEGRYVASLEKLLEINPDDVLSGNMLGNHYFKNARYEDAGRYYRNVLKVESEHVPTLNNLAGIAFVRGEFKEARDLCLRVLAITPEEPTPLVNLGKAYFKLGKKDEAVDAWQNALDTDSGNKEARQYLMLVK